MRPGRLATLQPAICFNSVRQCDRSASAGSEAVVKSDHEASTYSQVLAKLMCLGCLSCSTAAAAAVVRIKL